MNKTINELLLEQSGNYKKAEIPDASFEIIPEGKYEAILSNVKIMAIKATQTRDERIVLRWEIKITSENYKNRMLSKFTELQGENIKWTKLSLKICTVEMDSLTELPKLLESGVLNNLPIQITVKINEWNGEDQNSFYINKVIKKVDDAF